MARSLWLPNSAPITKGGFLWCCEHRATVVTLPEGTSVAARIGAQFWSRSIQARDALYHSLVHQEDDWFSWERKRAVVIVALRWSKGRCLSCYQRLGPATSETKTKTG